MNVYNILIMSYCCFHLNTLNCTESLIFLNLDTAAWSGKSVFSTTQNDNECYPGEVAIFNEGKNEHMPFIYYLILLFN